MVWLIALLHAVLFTVLTTNLVYFSRRRRRTSPSSWPSVSVLVPARNEESNLRRLLPSLLEQQYDDFEVIVYDDGSEDGTWHVLRSFDDERLHTLRGQEPPPGWVGKVYALFQATRKASNELFLFLDADARLLDERALQRMIERYTNQRERLGSCFVTGFTHLRGGGKLLTSLVPHVILTSLPWPLVARTRSTALSSLNGQCWILASSLYYEYEPHEHVAHEVLEDVKIGRYLKRQGVTPVMVDVQQEVDVYMYADLLEAWRGFRKNAFPLMGGTVPAFLSLYVLFLLCFVLAPLFSLWFLPSIFVMKLVSDRQAGFPFWVSLAAPVSFLLAAVLQFDSAFCHLTSRVSWKGRQVG